MSASNELETPLISPTAATPLFADQHRETTAPPISVDAQLVNDEQQHQQHQQHWFDNYRAREPTYYGAWRQVYPNPLMRTLCCILYLIDLW